MKKTILSILAVFAMLNAHAQLEVDANGVVILGDGTTTNSTVMKIGNTTNLNTFTAINVKVPAVSTGNAYGLVCDARNNSLNGSYIGVAGFANGSNNRNNVNYGLWGRVTGNNAVAVYGSSSNHMYSISGTYAAVFDGPVLATSNVQANNYITTSDMNLKQNIASIDEESDFSALDNLLKMNVVSYNYKEKEGRTKMELEGDAKDEAYEAYMEKENQRLHFGLLAQELQTIYPNLVYEGQDGYLGINYTELVPVLIQSVKELKSQLDELQGNPQVKSRAATADNTIAESLRTSKLFQNTPNPSKGATTIKFVLGDNVQSACISIFDMQGKAIKNIPVDNGMESITVSASEIGYGMFLYSLVADGYEIDTKRMILTK